MTRHAAEAAENLPNLPILQERDEIQKVGILLVTSDRGLAGAFNSQIVRAGLRAAQEIEADGKEVVFSGSGRRGVSSLTFRKRALAGSYTGFTDRPSYGNAREIASDLIAAYVDGEVDRVEILYNHYISPLQQRVTRETLLPLQQASILEEGEEDESEEDAREEQGHHRALVEYEPEPGEILERLVPTLRGDLDLPRPAGVDRVRARRAHDRHAQRLGERGRAHRHVHPADEPRATGGHHAGDHGSRRRRRVAGLRSH